MTEVQIIKQVQVTQGTNNKKEFLKNNATDNVKKLLQIAFDSSFITNIKKLPEVTPDGSNTATIEEFFALAEYCATYSKSNTTNEKVKKFLERCTKLEMEVYGEVLTKSLRIGLAKHEINKVFPNLIKDFKVALASPYHSSKLTMPCLCEEKIDGIRCVIIKDGSNIKAFTRNGLRLNLPTLFRQLLKYAPSENYVLDGELVNIKSRTKTMSIINRILKGDGTDEELEYMLFDRLTVEEFNTQHTDRTLQERRKGLREFYRVPKVKEIYNCVVYNSEQLKEELKKIQAQGGEGLVLKNINGFYEWKRSKEWTKAKLKFFLRAEITGFTKGKGAFSGQIGAIECTLREDAMKIRVSSGLSNADRKFVTENQEALLGEVIVVGFNALQQDENGNYFIDFPTFEGFDVLEPSDTLGDVIRETQSGGEIV